VIQYSRRSGSNDVSPEGRYQLLGIYVELLEFARDVIVHRDT